uniref:Uncharacterized protein n=1 Tax=Siphoviridae sp. ct3o911 TaxID=2827560 RepID=A0A8S5LJL7_9CAUD|nr:MAG TPA: hypothetical protein [Siphoviridae sp. ct3o911]
MSRLLSSIIIIKSNSSIVNSNAASVYHSCVFFYATDSM